MIVDVGAGVTHRCLTAANNGVGGVAHPMVVWVLEVELNNVLVDGLDRPIDLHPRHPELLELHQRHRSGGVLQQRLVHPDRDRGPGRGLTLDEVCLENLPAQVRRHPGAGILE